MNWVLRFLVAAVLIGAGILKAADPVPVLTGRWYEQEMLTTLLPWIEIVAGMLLLCELPLRWTAWPAIVLCGAFALVSISTLITDGVADNCGCFGVIASPRDHWHAVGVLLLFALACGLLLLERRRRALATTR